MENEGTSTSATTEVYADPYEVAAQEAANPTVQSTNNDAPIEGDGEAASGSSADTQAAGENTDDTLESSDQPKGEGDWKNRFQGMQSAKDKQIAELNRQLEEANSGFSELEKMIIASAVQNARQTFASEPEKARAAEASIISQYNAALEQRKLESEKRVLAQQKQEMEGMGAVLYANKLANDPRFKGHVTPEDLMEVAQFGANAMNVLAAKMSMGGRKTAITERKAAGADRVGSNQGAGASKYGNMRGSDLLGALVSEQRQKLRIGR